MSEFKVALVMGSQSDMPTLEGCIKTLEGFGVSVDVFVLSAHRMPNKAAQFAKDAEKNGYSVIIGAAGKAAHLPGVLAAYTPLPVIGVPISGSAFGGMDSLLSIVQMPKGVPVATVAVDGGDNAAILAAQIISLASPEIRNKIKEHKRGLEED